GAPCATEIVPDRNPTAAGRKGADAMLMLSSPVFGANSERIAGLTLGLRLPAVSLFPGFARAGGLMAYGVDPVNNFREVAALVARVLRAVNNAGNDRQTNTREKRDDKAQDRNA